MSASCFDVSVESVEAQEHQVQANKDGGPSVNQEQGSSKMEGLKKTAVGQDVSVNIGIPSDLSTGHKDKTNERSYKQRREDHTGMIAIHYNSIANETLSYRNQSRIMYMRNFNNWTKSMLINEYMGKVKEGKSHGIPIKVLDMCCGKGGDLLKWKKARIAHLICTDIAHACMEQCQRRYNEIVNRSSNERGFAPLFTAEFITADCTKVRLREKFRDPSTQIDIISCQFAFHYSFESLQQAECMLRNASESLRPGGYFIGTMPNAYELVWRKCDGNKIGNNVYSIEFSCDKEKPPLFGAKYNFHLEDVVNCPEFLVYLPALRKLALKYGLELVAFESFEDYYERLKGEGKSLLAKMQALETYPPYYESPLLGEDLQDYQHAVRYMQNLVGHRKVGTLSKSEWEAISLYATFAFRKMKTTWNNVGKPEYVKL